MNTQTRFLTGGLASIAIASAVTLASPAYAADEPARACGQPAVPAVYVTVTHDPELRPVPAVTHVEWRWERTVTTTEYAFSRVVTAAHTETTDRTREDADGTEYLWSHTVIDQAAEPAVPGTPEQGHYETVVVTPAVTATEFEYVQQTTGHLQWHAEGWNTQNGDEDTGKGWTWTGNTRPVTIKDAVTEQQWVVDQAETSGTPARDEVSHTEETWAAVPGGDGWTKVEQTTVVPAVVDTVWAGEAPEGYTATGASRSQVTTEQTEHTSASAPQGDGWSEVADSRVEVVDQPETTELVGSGYTEQVLVSPGLAASDPCIDAAQGAAEISTGTAAGPKSEASAAVAAVHVRSSASVDAASAGTATVLPATGSPVSPLLLTAGLGAVLAGSVLVRTGRRHTR